MDPLAPGVLLGRATRRSEGDFAWHIFACSGVTARSPAYTSRAGSGPMAVVFRSVQEVGHVVVLPRVLGRLAEVLAGGLPHGAGPRAPGGTGPVRARRSPGPRPGAGALEDGDVLGVGVGVRGLAVAVHQRVTVYGAALCGRLRAVGRLGARLEDAVDRRFVHLAHLVLFVPREVLLLVVLPAGSAPAVSARDVASASHVRVVCFIKGRVVVTASALLSPVRALSVKPLLVAVGLVGFVRVGVVRLVRGGGGASDVFHGPVLAAVASSSILSAVVVGSREHDLRCACTHDGKGC